MSAKPPRTPLPWTRRTILWLTLADDINFAVRAANSHDDLLAALKELCRNHNARGSDGPCDCSGCRIIAKAEERS